MLQGALTDYGRSVIRTGGKGMADPLSSHPSGELMSLIRATRTECRITGCLPRVVILEFISPPALRPGAVLKRRFFSPARIHIAR